MRFKFFLKYDYHDRKVNQAIDKIDKNIRANISKCDELQDYLEIHPLDDNKTREYERYNHLVKEDLSSLRKLEAFVKRYNPSYIPKPEYPGEERDNVNTY